MSTQSPPQPKGHQRHQVCTTCGGVMMPMPADIRIERDEHGRQIPRVDSWQHACLCTYTNAHHAEASCL